jgi:RHS repeat-associated protein
VLRRVTKSAAGTWTWQEDYVYRGSHLLAAEVPDNRKTLRFHLDHLGTPRLITANGGVEVARPRYFPFGQEVRVTADADKLKFTGHERDGRSLDYMHARYYDPLMGRFLSVDPPWESADLKKPQSWNRYAYVLNNPVNLTDPDGKCPFCVQVLKELAVDFVVDGSPTGSADLPKDPAQRAAYAREMQQWRLEQRAKEIHGALPEATQRRTTTAVAEVTNPDGSKQILVASSEKNLRPAQRAALRPG